MTVRPEAGVQSVSSTQLCCPAITQMGRPTTKQHQHTHHHRTQYQGQLPRRSHRLPSTAASDHPHRQASAPRARHELYAQQLQLASVATTAAHWSLSQTPLTVVVVAARCEAGPHHPNHQPTPLPSAFNTSTGLWSPTLHPEWQCPLRLEDRGHLTGAANRWRR